MERFDSLIDSYPSILPQTAYNCLNEYSDGSDPFTAIGVGCSLNSDQIICDYQYGSIDNYYLKLADGGTYLLKYSQYGDPSSSININGYKLSNLRLQFVPYGEYQDAFWKLSNVDGTIKYFNSSGNILAVFDKFGNTITYEWRRYQLDGEPYTTDVAITGTGGDITVIETTLDGTSVVLPDSSEIKYNNTIINGAPYVTSKVDQLGNVTKFEYTDMPAKFNGWNSIYPVMGYPLDFKYANLTKVIHPTGATTHYTYDKSTAYYPYAVSQDYYRVSSRYDKDPRFSNEELKDKELNKEKYTYSQNSFWGYDISPHNPKDLPIDYVYWTQIEYANGQTKKYTFNNKHLIKTVESINDRTDYTYDSKNLPSKIEHTLNGASGNKLVRTEMYTYDYYGNMLTHNNGLDTIRYTYDANNFYMLKKKEYKKDSQTNILEEFLVEGNYWEGYTHKSYEGGILKSQTDYLYDDYGNTKHIAPYVSLHHIAGYDYIYDDFGVHLLSNSLGEQFEYDRMGRLKRYVDPNENVTSYEYNDMGQMTRIENPDGSVSEKNYIINKNDNKASVKNENGINTVYNYDGLGNLILITIDGKKMNSYKYDLSMRLIEESDAKGIKSTYTYDARDRLKVKKIGAEYEEIYDYDDAYTTIQSKLTKTIKGEKNAPDVITAVYMDKYGRTDKESRFGDGLEYSTLYEYDYLNNPVKVTNDLGQVIEYKYDYMGNVTEVNNKNTGQNNKDIVFKTTYDWLGLKTSVTDPRGNVSKYEYDALNRLVIEEIPFENGFATTKSYVYDNNGNVLTQEVSSNKPGEVAKFSQTSYTYDSRNRLTKVETFDNGAVENYTQYKYDNVGNKTEMITANGAQTTKYEYDSLNRLTKLTDALSQPETYEYDLNGNLTKKIDRNGVITENTYDGLNRLTKAMTAGGETLEFTYAKTGAKLSEKNGNLTTSFVYDSLGRLTKQTESNNIVKDYKYDSLDNRTEMSVKKNGVQTLIQTYKYDNMNRLAKVYDGVTSVNESAAPSAEYSYDDNGNRKSLKYSNGVETAYTYNNANLVTSLVNKKDGAVLSSYTYAYYLDGNQASKADNTGKNTTYTYDGLGRLTNETEKLNNEVKWSKSYTFDKANNRQTMTVSGDENYTTTYSYDKNNRLLKETKSVSLALDEVLEYKYDKNGNQISKTSYNISALENAAPQVGIYVVGQTPTTMGGITTELYDFNDFNQLVQVVNDKGTTEYAYKPDGLRLSKDVDGDVTTHVWDGSNIIMELDSNNAVTDKYIRGINLIKSDGNEFYLFNAHGDVVQLADNGGNVVKSYQYDAFGVEIGKDDNDTNPWRYCGEYWDEETSTIYLRNRHYSPRSGRFTSEDPIMDGLNWYTYCGSNPIVFIDPLGLIPTVMEAALMAEHIYNAEKDDSFDERTVSGGWILINVITNDEGLKMGIYSRVDKNGVIEYALVNKGTSTIGDWVNNIKQPFGLSKDMEDSIREAKQFVENHKDSEVTMVGHSKGGAEAAGNAITTNTNCIVFNSALPSKYYGIEEAYKKYTANIQSFRVDGDVLLGFYRSLGIKLEANLKTQSDDPVENHMMFSVIKALKEEGYK